jgi:hypothetical protein
MSELKISKEQEGKSRSSYHRRYHQEIAMDPLRFRLAKGEFTEYLNKNVHYRSIGPLQGI